MVWGPGTPLAKASSGFSLRSSPQPLFPFLKHPNTCSMHFTQAAKGYSSFSPSLPLPPKLERLWAVA